MLQRGSLSAGLLRGATNLWRGRGVKNKSWLAGLPKQLASRVVRSIGNGGSHVMIPMSRDLLGKLPKLIM